MPLAAVICRMRFARSLTDSFSRRPRVDSQVGVMAHREACARDSEVGRTTPRLGRLSNFDLRSPEPPHPTLTRDPSTLFWKRLALFNQRQPTAGSLNVHVAARGRTIPEFTFPHRQIAISLRSDRQFQGGARQLVDRI